MLSASTILSTLTGAAQKEILTDAAKTIGIVDKKEQMKAIEVYFKGKFSLDQFNAISGLFRNFGKGLKQ